MLYPTNLQGVIFIDIHIHNKILKEKSIWKRKFTVIGSQTNYGNICF